MKGRDYRDFNKAMSDDFMVFVNLHPDSFDILLFKPDMATLEKVAVDQDVVGALEAEERALEYLDPVMVKAVMLPDDVPFASADVGGEPDGEMEHPVVLLIADSAIPKQSVVQYREFINDTDVRVVSLYIMRSEIVGEAPGVCEKHYCVPFNVFDYEFIEPPANDVPDDDAVDVSITPALSASEFVVHGTDDTHGKSQWQVRTDAGAYATPAYDSGVCADLRSHVVPTDHLSEGNAYFWHVRYRGAAGDAEGEEAVWSDWSGETKFTTLEVVE